MLLAISIATEESDEAFAARLPQLVKNAEFLRTIEAPAAEALRAAHKSNLNWIDATLTGVSRKKGAHRGNRTANTQRSRSRRW